MTPQRPQLVEVEAAVKTLLLWAGDDPEREGLRNTPNRVARAYGEFFSGYSEDPHAALAATFEETEDYDDIVLVRNIRMESHCEHHLVPIIGRVHIAYLPDKRVVGLSKLARVVDIYAKRLQIQERLTSQIANTIAEVLQPRGVAVIIEAEHMCMSTRGVYKPGSTTVTQKMLGIFRTNPAIRTDLLSSIGMTNPLAIKHG